MPNPILISGIQPTGRLHLGNYLGALKQFVELQNSKKPKEYECLFFIADYHSLTIDFDPAKKSEEVLALARAYLAAGIDPEKSSIFVQSHIPESTELNWILNTITPIGELNRMTQFKEKTDGGYLETYDELHEKIGAKTTANIVGKQMQQKREFANVGLFTYPTLMAADILLYDAEVVPVGDDQLQHLELTRTLARKFNNKFGETFTEPQALLTKTPRVMSLNDPMRKMSKSQPEGCLFLDDSPKDIESKIKRAVTDSGSEVKFDLKNKTGVSNLLLIYEALTGETIADLEKKYAGKGYGQFKSDLAKLATDSLAPFRDSKVSDKKLKSVLSAGDKKAKKLASAKMKEVKEKLGLL